MEKVLMLKTVHKDVAEAEIWAAGMKTLKSNGVRYMCIQQPNGTVESFVMVLKEDSGDVLKVGERRLIFNNVLEV